MIPFKSNSQRMNFDKTSRRAYRVMRLAYNIWDVALFCVVINYFHVQVLLPKYCQLGGNSIDLVTPVFGFWGYLKILMPNF